MEARIRRAEEGDAEVLARLCAELGYRVEPADLARRMAGLARSPERHGLFVAAPDGDPEGLCHVTLHESLLDERAALLAALVVGEAQRGRGHGRALVARAEAWAKERGCERLLVRSRTTRHGAHAFYARLGFAPRKEQVLLAKALAPDGA